MLFFPYRLAGHGRFTPHIGQNNEFNIFKDLIDTIRPKIEGSV